MNRSEIFSFVTSFIIHLLFLATLVFVVKPPIPKPVEEKFRVLLFYEPKSPALEQKKLTRLYAPEKSSGASKLAKNEESKAVKEGLKKGVTFAEQKAIRLKSEGRGQKPEASIRKGEKEFKIARKEIRNQEPVKKEEKGLKNFEEEINRTKKNLEEKGNNNETTVKGSSVAGKESEFSARKINKDLLAKYAGPSSKDGLGGLDDDGEGGLDNYGGAGKAVDLNTNDLRFLSYFKHLKDLIESVWVYPREAREKGIDGQLVIKFTIKESGELGPVEVVRSSGYKFLDSAALKALEDASPFPELPKRWQKKEITISGNFIYYLYRGGVFY